MSMPIPRFFEEYAEAAEEFEKHNKEIEKQQRTAAQHARRYGGARKRRR